MKKKSSKVKIKHNSAQPITYSTAALLLCFLIASVGVAIALRQVILERRLLPRYTQLTDPAVSRIVGSYSVTLPAAKAPTRKLTLTLEHNRTASLVESTEKDPTANTTHGSWSGDSNGTIIVTLGDQVYAFSYVPSASGSLHLLNPDVKLWGASTLTLVRQ